MRGRRGQNGVQQATLRAIALEGSCDNTWAESQQWEMGPEGTFKDLWQLQAIAHKQNNSIPIAYHANEKVTFTCFGDSDLNR